jgi:uncharacterized membrane protein
MSAQPPVSSDQSNEKLLSALTYPIPLVGIVILVSDTMKNNPVMKKHAVQSLALGVVLAVFFMVLSILPVIGSCVAGLIWLGVTIYYAMQAYNGKDVVIPVITDFCKKQNWF